MFTKFKSKLSKKSLQRTSFLSSMMLLAFTNIASATTTSGTLELNFDVNKMFTWTQTIINALMPVVYVTLGISLGFLIIRALKSAFN